MSAKRPRPAIPVLVHVDNPAEVGSVTVDTSTIEGKIDTVINNQERIYDKIPTSGGGGGGSSADLTTVNEKTTALAETIGPADSNLASNNLFGFIKNISATVGNCNSTVTANDTHLRSILYNIRQAVGSSTKIPTASETTVRGLLTAIKENTASGGGGGSADLTTVNAKITALAETIGSADSKYTDDNLIGKIKNIALSTGEYGGVLTETATGLRSLLYNVRQSVGDCTKAPSATGTTVRDLLAAIKRNTESGDDLTTVNDKITAINAAVGDGAVLANDQSLIGLAKGIKASLGSMDASDAKSSSNIKGRLFNIQSSIGDALNSPSTTGTSVRDLLAAIKENTASGGSGGSADLTTVNEKTTALAAAIGSASDDSSTVSVIGLLKSITDKY